MNTTQTAVGAERIDAVEVQERLDWQAMRAGQAATVTIDTAALIFLPNGPHQVAAMANLGADLLQEIQAYRPQFLFKSSPAEIVGALIEEQNAPTAATTAAGATFARQLIDSGAENYIGEVFDTERGDIEVTARYTLGKTPAEKLADLKAAISAAPDDTKDAERYRWLTVKQGLRYNPSGGLAIADIGDMNTAIDTAIFTQNGAKP